MPAGNMAGLSVAQARRALADLFRTGQIESADADARILLAHATALDQAALAANPQRLLAVAEAQRLTTYAARRLRHEPVARILGQKEFWGLTFGLSGDTLVPRPETETLVEAALDCLQTRRADSLTIADFGTGSGALLLALLSELPNAFGVGTDISLGALGRARDNARRLRVEPRAAFVRCDFGSALGPAFDLIVCNPPYIASAEIGGLDREVRDFDPRRALDGGADGLDAYRAVAADVPRLLAANARLIVELGAGQMDAVCAVMSEHGLTPAEPAGTDLFGHPRALILKARS
jgi:release factor glutamine methyltransferase